jgi:hypothetical protein
MMKPTTPTIKTPEYETVLTAELKGKQNEMTANEREKTREARLVGS